MPYPDSMNWSAFDRAYGTPEDDAREEAAYDTALYDIMIAPDEFVCDWFFESDEYTGDDYDADEAHYLKQAQEWARSTIKHGQTKTARLMPALEAAFRPSLARLVEHNLEGDIL